MDFVASDQDTKEKNEKKKPSDQVKKSDTSVELKQMSSSSGKFTRSEKSARKSQAKMSDIGTVEKDQATLMKNTFMQNKKNFADFKEVEFNEVSLTCKISWEVRSINNVGDTDVDISCLMFDKYGRWIDTCYWDNLSCEFLGKDKTRLGVCIKHGGDQVAKQLEAEDDDDLEEQRQEQGGTEEPESIDVFPEKLPDEVATLIFALNIFTGGKYLQNINHLEIQLTPKDKNGNAYAYTGSPVGYTLDSIYKLASQHSRHVWWERDVTGSKKSFLQNNNGLIFLKMHRTPESLNAAPKIFSKLAENATIDVHSPERMKNGKWKLQLLAREFFLKTGHPIEEQIPLLISSNIVHPKVNTWEEVRIKVIEAVDLLAMDYNGKSDPYVVINFIKELRVEREIIKKVTEKKDQPTGKLKSNKTGVKPSLIQTKAQLTPTSKAVGAKGSDGSKGNSKKDVNQRDKVKKQKSNTIKLNVDKESKETAAFAKPIYIAKTSVINSTLQPRWNHEIIIKHRDSFRDCDILKFSVFDSDYFGIFTGTPEDKWPFNAEGDIIGHVPIKLSSIPPNIKLDRWFTVLGECKNSTSLFFNSPCKICCTCPIEDLKTAGNLHLELEKIVTPQPPIIHTIK